MEAEARDRRTDRVGRGAPNGSDSGARRSVDRLRSESTHEQLIQASAGIGAADAGNSPNVRKGAAMEVRASTASRCRRIDRCCDRIGHGILGANQPVVGSSRPPNDRSVVKAI